MFRALIEGWRRALGAPALGAFVLLALLLTLLPPAVSPGDLVGRFGASVDLALSQAAALAMDISGRPAEIGAVAIRELIGFGSALAIAYLLFWIVLSGGILDRLARARPVGTAHFFATCGVYMLRFLRLGILVAPAYLVLFRLVRPHIGSRAEFLAFLAALAVLNLVVDYAKIRAVVEDRRSMLSALLASLRFVISRPIGTSVVYGVNLLWLVGVALLAERVMPPDQPPSAWTTFLVAQAYLFVRIVTRLGLMASEVAYFQGELAHAGYTAAPEVMWPDSPAVEAIENLTREEPKREGHQGYEGHEGSIW